MSTEWVCSVCGHRGDFICKGGGVLKCAACGALFIIVGNGQLMPFPNPLKV